MRGSEHNDLFIKKGKRLGTVTNKSGGIQGGISNGEEIRVVGYLKPIPTLKKALKSVDKESK